MKIFKSHFWYNKSQRNGIFFLIILIVLLQLVYVNLSFFKEDASPENSIVIKELQEKIDSLKLVEIENRKPKTYPFNPNFITDFKGYQLGMSVQEIDRLHNFRKQNKYVNSPEEFQNVTKVSDSLLSKISPYFKFPDWVLKKNRKQKNKLTTFKNQNEIKTALLTISTNDINKATKEDFETIEGVGEVIANRIIKYRNKLQGFSYENQLFEVWGLPSETVKNILESFKIVEKPIIKKINVNTATFKEVLKNPYINYELCRQIFDYRDEVAELQNISELRNIKDFPLDKYNRIVLYLEAK